MLKELGIFMVGGACGFAGAYLLLKNRYETMVKEADEAAMAWVKERTRSEEEEKSDKIEEDAVLQHRRDMEKYNKIRERMIDEEIGMVDNNSHIYRISEQDFVIGDEDFDQVSLEYYTDGESLYEGSECIPNIEDVVGVDNIALLHGAEDVIYVRNEDLRTDYEVSKIVGRFEG